MGVHAMSGYHRQFIPKPIATRFKLGDIVESTREMSNGEWWCFAVGKQATVHGVMDEKIYVDNMWLPMDSFRLVVAGAGPRPVSEIIEDLRELPKKWEELLQELSEWARINGEM